MTEMVTREDVRSWIVEHGRDAVTRVLRVAVEECREAMMKNGQTIEPPSVQSVVDRAERLLDEQARPSIDRVINATGVVIHTGLGRAPLCEPAVVAVTNVARGYCNLEFDLSDGGRRRRQLHVSRLLCEVSGAEAATVVNNTAAAMTLIMRCLCEDREVVISRGQLVEIGGSFRMPDVMEAGGAVLREVGTTNRTRIGDYSRAIGENTSALLRVHTSNFRIVGFSEEPSLSDIVNCAHEHHIIAIDDLGSGAMFDLSKHGLPFEPNVRESIRAGADLVCFSGDKILGGPQAGIILGRRDLVEQLDAHALMRSYRVDKMVLAALEATLQLYRDDELAMRSVPTLSMMHASPGELKKRAKKLHRALSRAMPNETFTVENDISVAGGGSLPGEGLATVVVRWRPTTLSADAAAKRLRMANPAIVTRIVADAVTFDVRTTFERDHADISAVLSSF
jgi:L-seryl-tRNA(Ser) seleniumtransferase